MERADVDTDKMAYMSHHGVLRFTRMPVGPLILPEKFQCVVDVKLSAVR